jgi:hypothetical protein
VEYRELTHRRLPMRPISRRKTTGRLLAAPRVPK